MPRSLNEFELIARYFAPLSGREGLGLLDDAACLKPPVGQDLIMTKDMIATDVHFLRDDDPTDVAWKALAVNVSDLSAKGAKPWVYLLGLGLSGQEDDQWLSRFAQGLKDAQDAFGIKLIGGDTISTGQSLCLSVTAIGLVAEGQMLARGGAEIGDAIYVSGVLGEAALGLRQAKAEFSKDAQDFTSAYFRPEPRIALGQALAPLANSCADVSDGLMADLGHICNASEKGAVIHLDQLPVVRNHPDFNLSEEALRTLSATHGDDYELVFTAPKAQENTLFTLSKDLGLKLTRVAEITDGRDVKLVDSEGRDVPVETTGYRHH